MARNLVRKVMVVAPAGAFVGPRGACYSGRVGRGKPMTRLTRLLIVLMLTIVGIPVAVLAILALAVPFLLAFGALKRSKR